MNSMISSMYRQAKQSAPALEVVGTDSTRSTPVTSSRDTAKRLSKLRKVQARSDVSADGSPVSWFIDRGKPLSEAGTEKLIEGAGADSSRDFVTDCSDHHLVNGSKSSSKQEVICVKSLVYK